jgi:hypothetical protein
MLPMKTELEEFSQKIKSDPRESFTKESKENG